MTETTNGSAASQPRDEQNQKAQAEAAQQAAPAVSANPELEAKLKEQESKYLYLYAEFENFKKRTIKERSELLKFGWESLARDLLQVMDNFERALEHLPPNADKNLAAGLQMIYGQMKSTLEKQGVQTISSHGHAFNPDLHEAIAQENSTEPAGQILKEQLKGYTLHGRLLRPARVVLSSGAS